MAETRKWPAVESNPEVLNTFASNIGLDTKKWSFCDVVDLSSGLLMCGDDIYESAPVIAYIFLFPGSAKQAVDASKKKDQHHLLFIDQINDLQDACGTIAMLHSLSNNREKISLDPNGILSKFIDSLKGKSSHECGLALYNDEKLRALHCATVEDVRASTQQVEVGKTSNHFVCFTTAQSGNDFYIVEIDGVKPFPIFHEKISQNEIFAQKASELIKKVYFSDPSITSFSTLALADISQNK